VTVRTFIGLLLKSIICGMPALAFAAETVPAIIIASPDLAATQTIELPGTIDLYQNKDFSGTKYRAIKPRLQIIKIDQQAQPPFVWVLFRGGQQCTPTNTITCAAVGEGYYVSKEAVFDRGGNVSQTVTGVLAVPFKFHTTDHSTTAGATIGGYLGRELYLSTFDVAFSPIIAGGLALVPQKAAVAQASTTKADSTTPEEGSTLTGVSAAVGLIGKAKSNFQFGMLVGWDWVGKSKNYKYEGKPWISFAFGYNFSGG
jgi:hypothetical protein